MASPKGINAQAHAECVPCEAEAERRARLRARLDDFFGLSNRCLV